MIVCFRKKSSALLFAPPVVFAFASSLFSHFWATLSYFSSSCCCTTAGTAVEIDSLLYRSRCLGLLSPGRFRVTITLMLHGSASIDASDVEARAKTLYNKLPGILTFTNTRILWTKDGHSKPTVNVAHSKLSSARSSLQICIS